MSEPVEIFKWIRDKSIKIEKAKNMSAEELKDKYVIGELLNIEKPTLTDKKYKIIKDLRGKS